MIVPGHAIYVGNGPEDVYDNNKWVGTYDKYHDNDEIPNYVEHIQRGIKHAVMDSEALLVFSGGKTRKGTQLTEAESYCNLAEQLSLLSTKDLHYRVRLEAFATDSFENLIFSLLLYRKLHPLKKFPEQVTVVGLAFKQERYQFHAITLKIMKAFYTIRETENYHIMEQFHEIGNFKFIYDAVNDVPSYMTKSLEGEKKTLEQFTQCPFGDAGILLEKRRKRDNYNWYRYKPYSVNLQ